MSHYICIIYIICVCIRRRGLVVMHHSYNEMPPQISSPKLDNHRYDCVILTLSCHKTSPNPVSSSWQQWSYYNRCLLSILTLGHGKDLCDKQGLRSVSTYWSHIIALYIIQLIIRRVVTESVCVNSLLKDCVIILKNVYSVQEGVKQGYPPMLKKNDILWQIQGQMIEI